MVGMAKVKLDVASMIPTRSYGTYPSPLADFATFVAAHKRILAGDETIVSIARDVGYKSSSAFSNAWRKLTGYTPLIWRVRPAKDRRATVAKLRRSLSKAA